jgi:hypothetical protein
LKLDNLEAKLQRMLTLERCSALGQLRHGDNTNRFAFGLRLLRIVLLTVTDVALLVCLEV